MRGGLRGRRSERQDPLGERMLGVEVERTAAAEAVPRRTNITKADREKYGFFAGCLGCPAWLTGRSSEACRRRLEKDTKYEPKPKVAKEGKNELLEKVLRKEEDSRKKRKDEEESRGAVVNNVGMDIEGAAASFSADPASSSALCRRRLCRLGWSPGTSARTEASGKISSRRLRRSRR